MRYSHENRTLCLYQKYGDDFVAGDAKLPNGRMTEFCHDLEREGLLLGNFNWHLWYPASHLLDNPAAIVTASFNQCQILLCAMLRLERFSPGVLENMRRRGVLLAILARLYTLTLSQAV
jgi:hypothetical protein